MPPAKRAFAALLSSALMPAVGLLVSATSASADPVPVVTGVEQQPLAAATQRLIEAMDYVGSPFSADERAALEKAIASTAPATAVRDIQKILDARCLVSVNINPESRVKVAQGPARAELIQQGWRTFLVKVHNEAGVTAELRAESPNAARLYTGGSQSPDPFGRIDPKKARKGGVVDPGEVSQRFLDLSLFNQQPLNRTLSGLELEYRVLQLYSRDVGKREAKLAFNVGQGTQDLGFRNEVNILFSCQPAVEVVLGVADFDGKPTMGSFLIRDKLGRVYPAPSRRLAPDFFFHPQIYPADGESVHLPPGEYTVEFTRGPEYLTDRRTIRVPDSVSHRENFELRRWVHAAKLGWYSGDHHVHAAGCAHYDSPSEGVTPKDMMRHILGEDLNIGCVLSWGPCWYFQKQFFEGKVSALSTPDYQMRYDVEVSGFPSQHCGHLCLLRLKDDDYPGTKLIEDWPSWDLPILKWGKSQNAVVGFSHSGWGLGTVIEKGDSAKGTKTKYVEELPNYLMAPFDGIGANEYIVDVVHDTCDFISAVDTPSVWELNIWYHTNNCGYRAKLSGETDFPCIYGEKVGLGRGYVKLDGKLDYDAWVDGIRDGRSYVGDGRSHLIDFSVNGELVGTKGSEVRLARPAAVKVKAQVAALLAEEPRPEIKNRPLADKPYWDIERARIGNTRQVPVELIVNGYPAGKKVIDADGSMQSVEFDAKIDRSSWVALRIFPSSHTNPVYVLVGGKPIRASRRSADWCLKAVDQCWSQKEPRIRASEKPEAAKAYEVAREAYRKILAECEVQ